MVGGKENVKNDRGDFASERRRERKEKGFRETVKERRIGACKEGRGETL